MKGNKRDGISLGTAAVKLRSMWNDMLNSNPHLKGFYWDDEFRRITRQMLNRARREKTQDMTNGNKP